MNQLNFLRTIKIIYIALLVGMLLFAGIALFLATGNRIFKINSDNVFTIVAPVILVAGIGASRFMFNTFIKKIEHAKTLQQKIGIYTTSTLIQYALIEGPVLLSIVAFLMSTNLFFFIFTAAGVLYYLSLTPKPEKIARHMNLTYDERGELGIK